MVPYLSAPSRKLLHDGEQINSFVQADGSHIDSKTISAFGEEWTKFNRFSEQEIQKIGLEYFDIIQAVHCSPDSVVLDLGCGSGRWSRYLAPHVRFIEAIDPSKAVISATQLNKDLPNVRVTQAGIDYIPFSDESFDFIMCLGVLHHVPDTAEALKKAARKLKKNGHFLLYIYYKLENRGKIYRALFYLTNILRKGVSKLPRVAKHFVCDAFAVTVYLPLILLSRVVSAVAGKAVGSKFPLSYYQDKSWHVIRNDALDRMGTPLEQRFTKAEIYDMMKQSGLEDIVFSENAPFWHAVGKKTGA
ncbi:MAG: class I SAM-dependent methyltransferase [Sphingobacteriia bacterium]|jgi:ubiquinone/menaquinone biosynthesis C-methylase UbiE